MRGVVRGGGVRGAGCGVELRESVRNGAMKPKPRKRKKKSQDECQQVRAPCGVLGGTKQPPTSMGTKWDIESSLSRLPRLIYPG